MTLVQRFKEVAEGSPDRVSMLVTDGESVEEYTYGRIYAASLQIARWLANSGIRKNDRVAIILENSPEWAMCYFGVLMAGGVAVPIDWQARTEQIRHILDTAEPRVIFLSPKTPVDGIQEHPTLERLVFIGETDTHNPKGVPFSRLLHFEGDSPPLSEPDTDDIASILFTSGTTGPPKGVMLTHRNFRAEFQSIEAMNAVKPSDNFLSILPLHHSFPFTVTLLTPLLLNARITYLRTLRSEMILKTIRDQGVSIFALTPQILQVLHRRIEERIDGLPLGLGRLLKAFLTFSWKMEDRTGRGLAEPILHYIRSSFGSRLRYFVSGGAKLDEQVALGMFKLGFKVIEGYGLTETAPAVCFNPLDAPKIGSAGKPMKGVEIRILEPDADGVGEILIRGEMVMKGYYKDEEATREVIRDGWFHSGDLGFLDGEGYLFVRGRLKDIIVLSSGKNVSSEEVQKEYLKAPTIKEIFVLPAPGGEKLAAVVVPNFKMLRDMGEFVYEKIKWDMETISATLESYKRVRDFIISKEELPKTRLGKIERHTAEAIYFERAGKERADRVADIEDNLSATGERVVNVLSKETGVDRVFLDDHLELDLGIDSLSRVELGAALEREFGIRIPEEEFLDILSVEDLIQYIESKGPEEASSRMAGELSWDDILVSEPAPELLRKIGLGSATYSRFVTLFSSLLFRSLFFGFFQLRALKRQRLGEKPYILAPNHASYLDGLLIFASMPYRVQKELFFLGYSRIFARPILRELVSTLRVIPVDAARNLVEALQVSAHLLRQGKIVCIFPEGGRSVSGEVRAFKKGVAILAEKVGVDIYPAYIAGSEKAWGYGKAPRPHPVWVIFGERRSPEELQALAGDGAADRHQAVSTGLREEVLALRRELETIRAGR